MKDWEERDIQEKLFIPAKMERVFFLPHEGVRAELSGLDQRSGPSLTWDLEHRQYMRTGL